MSLQHNLSNGLLTLAIDRRKLLVRGLIADGGDIIPLEDYGQTTD
jgi:hypothetical protein